MRDSARVSARIHVLCRRGDGEATRHGSRDLAVGEAVLIGREGDLGVGVDPVDVKVSRHAVRVERDAEGWRLTVFNRNGVVRQPWGQQSVLAERDSAIAWPRVALRVLGSSELQHWVLLDDPSLRIRPAVPEATTHLTETADPPRPLTVPQEEAVRTLFRELLAWPPSLSARPLQLKQVATRLGVGAEAIQRRLEEVRKKAVALGLSRATPLTDPEYLYVLVGAGYLQPADRDLHPLLLPPGTQPG